MGGTDAFELCHTRNMREFRVWQEGENGPIRVSGNAPEISRSYPNGTPREVVEMALCKQSTPSVPLARLSVSSSISLDQILELLKRAPRLHSVDIPETKQCDEALARYSSFGVPTSNA
jgi:hypothetical protein